MSKKKKNKVWAAPTEGKPLYRVKIDDGYYCGDVAWKPVPKEQADKMTHAQALRIRNHMKHSRIGFTASIEPVTDEPEPPCV